MDPKVAFEDICKALTQVSASEQAWDYLKKCKEVVNQALAYEEPKKESEK